MKQLPHRPTPCGRCPWRTDIPAEALPAERAGRLRAACGRPGAEVAPYVPMDLCNQHHDHPELVCAGWLAVHGLDHLGVRIAASLGGLPAAVLRPDPARPPLFTDLDTMLAGRPQPTPPNEPRAGAGAVEDTALDVGDPDTGLPRVLSRRCSTCVLDPADLMHLGTEHRRGFLRGVRARDGYVICHQTLPSTAPPGYAPAVCRGSYDKIRTTTVKIMKLFGVVEVDPPAPANTTEPTGSVAVADLSTDERYALIADLAGCMVDGYTPEQVNLVFDRLREVFGVELVAVWEYLDVWGFGGNSDFYLRAEEGRLRELAGDLWRWLNDSPDDPDRPTTPGSAKSWVGHAADFTLDGYTSDGAHNAAAEDRRDI
ncbi:DUF6283 family protein [Catellatospora citrea]|uniref:DUF6283 family protein n=1 Tax=Catellatospora citrea TaxID=53366 RepID=UPI0033EC0165